MIVHILKPSASFKAVRYNTNKVDRNKGELMKVSGFGALGAMENVRPDDFKNYLMAQSALNKRVRFAQFHAVISAKGKEHNKDELTAIAEKWLAEMGYGNQPYLIIFHKDTLNNHVHIVSTRIDSRGKKISSGFEKIRAVKCLNRIMGVDEQLSFKADLDKALKYSFSTQAQFRMIMESKGYALREQRAGYEAIKFGTVQGLVKKDAIDQVILGRIDSEARRLQLRAIFHKYAASLDTTLTGKSSEFSWHLKETLGIELVFHASANKEPYGYSVIDHARQFVFKGSEIMRLKELTGAEPARIQNAVKPISAGKRLHVNAGTKAYYSTLIAAAINNYPDLRQGLTALGLRLMRVEEGLLLTDINVGGSCRLKELFDEPSNQRLERAFDEAVIPEKLAADIPDISLAPDIDDEAIHGRKRKRKKKARTNSR